MKLVYAADLHGQTSHYAELLELSQRESARAIVLGGDLLPSPRGLSSPAGRADAEKRQLEYLEAELMPCLGGAARAGQKVLLLLGNYDLGATSARFEESATREGLLTLHERAQMVDGLVFCGLSWVNFTPFPLKDWETWDLAAGEPLAGALDHRDPRAVFTWTRRDPFVPLAESLEALAGRLGVPPAEAIYVLHAPPHGTGLDVVSRKENPVGSRAVRRFIEAHQPMLTFHGHIHEAPEVSGVWAAKLGNTLAIQPGQSVDRLHAVSLDTLDPEATVKHTIYGRPELAG